MDQTNAHDFVCVECGRQIWRAIPLMDGEVRMCAECIMIPGWFDDTELRRILDPTNDCKPLKF